jgi:hypothetical protein
MSVAEKKVVKEMSLEDFSARVPCVGGSRLVCYGSSGDDTWGISVDTILIKNQKTIVRYGLSHVKHETVQYIEKAFDVNEFIARARGEQIRAAACNAGLTISKHQQEILNIIRAHLVDFEPYVEYILTSDAPPGG